MLIRSLREISDILARACRFAMFWFRLSFAGTLVWGRVEDVVRSYCPVCRNPRLQPVRPLLLRSPEYRPSPHYGETHEQTHAQ